MLKDTKNKMIKYWIGLPACSARAQCLNIANLPLVKGQTIAECIESDHHTIDGALRAMALMEQAGAATQGQGKKHCYGVFTFEDGSTFPLHISF